MQSNASTRRQILRAAGATALCAMPGLLRAQAPVDIKIAMSSTSFALASVLMADKTGVFARHGLNAHLITMDSGSTATTALLARSVEFSASAPSEVLTARARKQPVVIVANVYRGLPASVILAKAVAERTGIPADAPVDKRLRALDGLTIATPSATSSYTTALKNGTDSVGAKPKFIYMAQPAMMAALESGAIQAAAVGSPFWNAAVSRGIGVLWISGPTAELPEAALPTSSSCLQCLEDYAKSSSDTVKRLQDVVFEMVALIKDHPDEAKLALGKAYPTLSKAEIDFSFPREVRAWTQPVFSEADIRKEIELLKGTGASIPGLDFVTPASVLQYQRA